MKRAVLAGAMVAAGLAAILLLPFLAVVPLAGQLTDALNSTASAATNTGRAPSHVPGIPARYLAAYTRNAGACKGLTWTLLAGFGKIESGHGSNMGPSSVGAIGPMQFMPATWNGLASQYDLDGDNNGTEDPWDIDDAARGTAMMVCADGHHDLSNPDNQYAAIFAYNHADWYVKEIQAASRGYDRYTVHTYAAAPAPGTFNHQGNPRSVNAALAWDAQMDRNNTTIPPGACLHYVAVAYGWPNSGTHTAVGMWYAEPARNKHQGMPPRGALIFWRTSNSAGHVAISAGAGYVYSTDAPSGQIGRVPLSYIDAWGPRLGWSPPYFPAKH